MHALFCYLGAVVKIIEQGARFRVEPDMPHPMLIVDLTLGFDGDLYAEEMRDPTLQHAAQCLERLSTPI